MFKRIGVTTLALAAALLFVPGAAQARDYEREHHRHRFSVFFGVAPRTYSDGYYDRWGYWHPYYGGYYDRGYYDRWGRWHRY
jgi:hypothetical protein